MRVSIFSPTDHIPDAGLDFMRRRIAEIAGLILVVAMLAYALSLASWSAADPSLNHAVDGPVRNLLGRPGAMVADIAMQMLGLAAIALLAPPLLWGWSLLRHRRLTRLRRRIILWIVGSAAAAGFAAILPITDRWPLPTGLGGVAGDALLAFPRWVSAGARPVLIACGFACAIIAILSLSAAAARGGEEPDPTADLEEAADRLAAERAGKARRSARESEDAEGEPGLALISLGALIHGVLALKAQIGRLWRARAAARENVPERAPWLDPQFNPDLAHPAMAAAMRPARRDGARQEPELACPPLEPGNDSLMDPGHSRFDPADYAPPSRRAQALQEQAAREQQRAARRPEPDDMASDVPWDDEPPPSARISAPAPAPKPGRRITREKQPSLLDRSAYEMPPLGMLSEPRKIAGTKISNDALEQNARLLEGVLEDFGVKGEIINVRPGPVVTLYELEPAPGIKSSRVIGLADDIARSMSAISARVAVVQGRNAIGIELPNQKRETVFLRELLASQDFEKTKHKLSIALGKTIGGEPVMVDLAKMPHLLVAGTTGSGKSVAINTMILSLLYRLKPEECRLIMVDPKMLELSVYDGIPHLLTPVVTDPKKAVVALKWAVREMEDRYKKMSKLGVRNIDGFNARVGEANKNGEIITRTVQTGYDRETGEAIYEQEQMELSVLPYIVVIVDEMADLMMVAGKDIEGAIQRLAQMARAAGIHLIMATQRPSVDVITGTIKANFPTRISFQVTSKIDSRTILGEQGAEQLLGQGDMLYMAGGGRISRVHGPFVADNEVEKVVAHLKMQGQPDYLEAITEEDAPEEADGPAGPAGSMDAEEGGDLYDRAVNIVLRDRKVSTSYIQRRLSVGYNKAASLVERMEKEGVVSPANHSGKREILVGGGIDRGAYELQDED